MIALVTGVAGFTGANLVKRIIKENRYQKIIGLDILNDYYDVNIKKYRLEEIDTLAGDSECEWVFERCSIADKKVLPDLFEEYRPDVVVNLTAQPGV